MKTPKLFQKLLNLTADSKRPTDRHLDEKIEEFKFYFPYVYKLLKHIINWKVRRFIKYEYKYYIKITTIFTVIILGVYFSVTSIIEPYINKTFRKQYIAIEKVIYSPTLKSFDDFMDAVGFRESGNVYTKTNKYGMLGRFQFDPNTLKSIGININSQDFLSNPDLQRGAFIQLLKLNKKTFYKYIYKYNYQRMPGVHGVVTESGILMCFHLKPADAIIFFESNGKHGGPGDANGTKVKEYLEEFSGYKLPF